MNNLATWLILIAVLILGVAAVIYISFASKRAPRLKVEYFRSRWLAIENSLDKNNSASWQLAILNADKLVDKALRDSRYKGETMGERMKSAEKTWSHANYVWGAHKVRNTIAHESDPHVNYDIARRALAGYKQALKDLGAI